MMFRRNRFLAVIVVLAAVWIGWQLFGPGVRGGDGVGTGRESAGSLQAPDFTLTGLDGRQYRLSDYRGKKVLINFWTTWCPYCRDEMPLLQKFHEQYGGGNWQVLTVNMTVSEKGLSPVRDYIAEKGYTFPVLLDRDGSVSGLFRVSSIPASFILNENGGIIRTKIGPFSQKEMAELGSLK